MPTRQFAAIDLGSNSFHMVLARVTASDQIQIIDRDKEYVRLGGGLDADRNLTPEVLQAAYACLSRFSDRLEALPPEHVRCVGTNALRQAKNAHLLLEQGAKILGHPIEVIAGLEEARLIYEGAGLEQDRGQVGDFWEGSDRIWHGS